VDGCSFFYKESFQRPFVGMKQQNKERKRENENISVVTLILA
jgi:hypothetical protein